MIMGASTFPGVLVRGSRMRFATGGRGLGDLMTDCEGPHPNCSPLDQACIANWQNIISACQPVPPGAGITRELSTSSPKFAAQLAAAGGDEMLALQAQGNPVLPSHPAAAWWGGPGGSVAGNPWPYSSSHHNPGAHPSNPLQQQVRINPTNLPIRPLPPRPPLRAGYGQTYLPAGTVIPGWYSSVAMPNVATGLGRLRRRRGLGGDCPAQCGPDQSPGGSSVTGGCFCLEDCGKYASLATFSEGVACNQRNQAVFQANMSGPFVNEGPSGPNYSAVSAAINPPPAVVNPSPSSQATNTGSTQASPTSALNLARGSQLPAMMVPRLVASNMMANPSLVSTVGGTVSTGNWFSDPTQDVITGLPNWALLIMAGAGLYVIVNMAIKR